MCLYIIVRYKIYRSTFKDKKQIKTINKKTKLIIVLIKKKSKKKQTSIIVMIALECPRKHKHTHTPFKIPFN